MATPLTPMMRGPLQIAKYILLLAGLGLTLYGIVMTGWSVVTIAGIAILGLGIGGVMIKLPPPSGRWK
ncbi:MAG: hypothetical protein AAFZ01_03385 [Pseudomonadota bacterium]